jgi:carbamoyl-phosphate synthase small subunit
VSTVVSDELPPALLAMEDGTVYRGKGFGAPGDGAGEIVFNTAITGYQEVLTDPSYRGQIVTMTAPEIGNVGINALDFESARPWCAGFVVRELSSAVSNWRASGSLHELAAEHGVAGSGSRAPSARSSPVRSATPPGRSNARAATPRSRGATWCAR